jgi:hypothetical protein
VARRQQRRRSSFRPPRGATPEPTREDALVEAGARRLLGIYDSHSLESLVRNLRRLRDEADQIASDQPSPDALRAYRRAARELTEAEHALALIGRQN